MKTLFNTAFLKLVCIFSMMHHGALLTMYEESLAFMKPISMERADVATYFSQIFNREGYGPFSLSHLDQFLRFGSSIPQGQLKFTASMIDLFLARMKEAICINPIVVNDFLKTVMQYTAPALLASCQLQVEAVTEGMKERLSGHASVIKQKLAYELKNGFYVLKFDPELFLTRLTEAIIQELPVADLAHHAVQAMLQSEALHVRSSLLRIIEAALDRLVWSPVEEGFAWENVKDIANNLFSLYRCGIIDHEQTLHQLYWTLTYRFVYCLELIGERISPAAYELMQQDIMQGSNILLTFSIGDQPMAKSRRDWLADAVMSAMVRSRIAATGSWVGPLRSEYDQE